MEWATYLWRPGELTALLSDADADVEAVAELRLPPPLPGLADQALLAARRPG